MDTISSLAVRYVSWLNFQAENSESLLLTLFDNCVFISRYEFEVGRHHTKVVVFGTVLLFLMLACLATC